MTIIQAAVLGITAVALAVQLKPLRQEYSVYLILAAGLVIGFLSISRLELILDTVRAIGSQIRVKNIYLGTLLKMVGITYIAEFASGICRDAGFSALGTQVEMFGKLSILAVSAPVLQALLETLQVFLQWRILIHWRILIWKRSRGSWMAWTRIRWKDCPLAAS